MIFGRALSLDPEQTQSILKGSLGDWEQHPLLKKRLPARWALLIDGHWDQSSGYWHPDLQAPSGEPAILITPPNLLLRDGGYSLITHELTHLVQGSLRPREESWVREGMAMMSEFYATGSLNPALLESYRVPEAPLVSVLDPNEPGYRDENTRASRYGHIFLYFYYLHRICGGEELIDALFSSPSRATGVSLIDETLRKRASSAPATAPAVCRGFSASFRGFQLARFKQDWNRAEGFVVPSPMEVVVRDRAPVLAPYSAAVYARKKGCARGDVSWGKDRCIRIREK